MSMYQLTSWARRSQMISGPCARSLFIEAATADGETWENGMNGWRAIM